jgi:hypothetical protein
MVLVLREITSWHTGCWSRLAGSNFYCASTDPANLCPKTEPRKQRGFTLYTLESRLQKQKAKLNPYLAACDFIGYFIFPVLCDLHVSILWVLSLLCHPLPRLISRTQSVFFFPSSPPFLLHLHLLPFSWGQGQWDVHKSHWCNVHRCAQIRGCASDRNSFLWELGVAWSVGRAGTCWMKKGGHTYYDRQWGQYQCDLSNVHWECTKSLLNGKGPSCGRGASEWGPCAMWKSEPCLKALWSLWSS